MSVFDKIMKTGEPMAQFNYGIYGNYYGYINKITLKQQQASAKKYILLINQQ